MYGKLIDEFNFDLDHGKNVKPQNVQKGRLDILLKIKDMRGQQKSLFQQTTLLGLLL